MLSNVKQLYAIDCLRADGYPVRLARLGMLDAHTIATMPLVWALCWAMEFLVYAAFYVPRWRGASSVLFYVAYLLILIMV